MLGTATCQQAQGIAHEIDVVDLAEESQGHVPLGPNGPSQCRQFGALEP